jgi:hypothetical protein
MATINPIISDIVAEIISTYHGSIKAAAQSLEVLLN